MFIEYGIIDTRPHTKDDTSSTKPIGAAITLAINPNPAIPDPTDRTVEDSSMTSFAFIHFFDTFLASSVFVRSHFGRIALSH